MKKTGKKVILTNENKIILRELEKRNLFLRCLIAIEGEKAKVAIRENNKLIGNVKRGKTVIIQPASKLLEDKLEKEVDNE